MASESAIEENSETVFSFETLVSKTIEAKKTKIDSYTEKLNNAYLEARNEIVKGCREKMERDASKGYDKSILYSFEWVDDPKATTDKNGNKTIFTGNIRLLDMLYKGRPEFMKLMNDYFNRGQETPKFHCGFFRKTDDETNLVNWSIFVSWAPYRENHNTGESDGQVVRDQKRTFPQKNSKPRPPYNKNTIKTNL